MEAIHDASFIFKFCTRERYEINKYKELPKQQIKIM